MCPRAPQRRLIRFAKCLLLFLKLDFQLTLKQNIWIRCYPWPREAGMSLSSGALFDLVFPQMERVLDSHEHQVSGTSFLTSFKTWTLTLEKHWPKCKFQSFCLCICFSLLIFSRKIVIIFSSRLFSQFPNIWLCLPVDIYGWILQNTSIKTA